MCSTVSRQIGYIAEGMPKMKTKRPTAELDDVLDTQTKLVHDQPREVVTMEKQKKTRSAKHGIAGLPDKPLPPSPPQKKIDVQKAIELRLKGVSYSDIGKHFGASKQAAIQALKPYVDTADIDVEVYKRNRADLMAAKGATVLAAITPEKAKSASARDLAIVFGTLFDKERLERGQSTVNLAAVFAKAMEGEGQV